MNNHEIIKLKMAIDSLATDDNDTGECVLCKSLSSEKVDSDNPIPFMNNLEQRYISLIDYNEYVNKLCQFLKIKDSMKKAIGDDIIYKADGSPFTENELNIINTFIRTVLNIEMSKIEENILRNYIIGNIIHAYRKEKNLKTFQINWRELPDKIIKSSLNVNEKNSIIFAIHHAANKIDFQNEKVRSKTIELILKARENREGPEILEQRLFSEIADPVSEMNRNWRRVAISETNESVTHGFLMHLDEGTVLRGVSLPGACHYCEEYINVKQYIFTRKPGTDYSNYDPDSRLYKKISNIWDKYIWVGKDNWGRSVSPSKKVPGGFERREHHELWTPCIPAHPLCRCHWEIVDVGVL